MSYTPRPIDTSAIQLPETLHDLLEHLAENVHENWAARRISDGWAYGPRRDDGQKAHPCLVPYPDLPESEKQYDRQIIEQTLKSVLAMGYEIRRREG